MSIIQFTLTVEEGKELIARGILQHPLFENARKKGKIILKGGTTVSRIAEKVAGMDLRISGRITERGTVGGRGISEKPHSIIVKNEMNENIDNNILEVSENLGGSDVVICGANAVDAKRQAALMAGSSGGGNVGSAVAAWYVEGVNVLIPAGIEKMVPGDLRVISEKTGRKGKDLAWGMSVGLILLPGEIINEVEATKLIADVDCYPLGSGGLGTASGSITLEAKGNKNSIEYLKEVIKDIKGKTEISGEADSLKECFQGCNRCRYHLGCGYKKGELEDE